MAFTALTAILLALKAPKPTVPSNDHSPRYDDLISGAEAAHIQCANVIDLSSGNAPKFFLAEFLPPRSVKI